MWCNFLILLPLLIYISQGTSILVLNSESIALSSNAVQEHRSKRDIKSDIQFIDLNFDVQYLIIDGMSLTELVKMAQTNRKFNSIAKAVFFHKYRDYIIEIEAKKTGEIHEYDELKLIVIKDNKLALSVLQLFGSLIKTLTIVNRFIDDYLSTNINKMANEYASDSITSLDLSFVKGNTFEQFALPFKGVENLSFSLNRDSLSGKIMPFDKLFPRLCRLKMTLAFDLDYSFIDCEFRWLEHVDIHVYDFSGEKKQLVEGLFRKNSRIRSVTTWNFPVDYVIEIHKMFPHLEQLTLRELDGINKPLHFAHVTDFTLDSFEFECINMLSFENLQSFGMFYDEDFFEESRQFFKDNRNISKLMVDVFTQSIDERFVQLIDELPDLNELIMNLKIGSMKPEFITRVIESHEKLTKFEWSTYQNYDESTIKFIFDEFKDEWLINYLSNRKRFQFERRTLKILE